MNGLGLEPEGQGLFANPSATTVAVISQVVLILAHREARQRLVESSSFITTNVGAKLGERGDVPNEQYPCTTPYHLRLSAQPVK